MSQNTSKFGKVLDLTLLDLVRHRVQVHMDLARLQTQIPWTWLHTKPKRT
jgi:hypothetical protein